METVASPPIAHQSTNHAQQTEGELTASPPLIAPPRSLLWIFLLGFTTSTLYYCFWLVGRARDVKALQDQKITPAWWFFVPLVAIAQLIALPRLAGRWDAIARERKLDNPQSEAWIPIAAFLCFACSIYFNFSFRHDWPLSWDLLAAFLTALAMLIFHLRSNLLANQLKDSVAFKVIPKWQIGLEALLLLVFMALWGFLAYDYFEQQREVQDQLGDSHAYMNEDLGIQMDLQGDEWLTVEIGSYSDGSAVVEFRNKAATAAIVIFKQNDDDESLNSLASFRFNEAEKNHSSNLECREYRNQFKPDGHMRAFLICESESLGDKSYDLQASIQLDDHIVEVLGMVSGGELSIDAAYQATLKTLSSVRGMQP